MFEAYGSVEIHGGVVLGRACSLIKIALAHVSMRLSRLLQQQVIFSSGYVRLVHDSLNSFAADCAES